MTDDITELTRLLPDPIRPKDPLVEDDLSGKRWPAERMSAERHRALRDQFLTDIESHDEEDVAPTRRRRRRKRWLIAVPSIAAALLLVLGAVSAYTFGVGKFWAGQTRAGDLLERIALVAASSTDIPPADQIRDDQYVFVETYGGFGGMQAAVDKDGHVVVDKVIPLRLQQRQIWLSVNGTRPGLLRDPRVSSKDILVATSSGDFLNAPNFRYLTTLPTNPDVLLATIYMKTWGAGPNPQQEAFVTIGDMMRESIIPAPLAEALYKAAARIPGITVVDDAVDALGRHGVAVARTHAGSRTEWIFDRETLQFLGERTVVAEDSEWGPPGTVTGSTAVVARAIVDQPGQLPG